MDDYVRKLMQNASEAIQMSRISSTSVDKLSDKDLIKVLRLRKLVLHEDEMSLTIRK